jgi:hypothetical protein
MLKAMSTLTLSDDSHSADVRLTLGVNGRPVSGSPARTWGMGKVRVNTARHTRFTPTPVGS